MNVLINKKNNIKRNNNNNHNNNNNRIDLIVWWFISIVLRTKIFWKMFKKEKKSIKWLSELVN